MHLHTVFNFSINPRKKQKSARNGAFFVAKIFKNIYNIFAEYQIQKYGKSK